MKSYQTLQDWLKLLGLLLLTVACTRVEAQVAPTTGTRAATEMMKTKNESAQAPYSSDSTFAAEQKRNALGLDILVSTSGFGLGVFYRRQYSEDLYGFGSFSISEVKDDREIELYNPFTGEKFVPNKVNRFFLLPMIFGVQYRLFREEIADNFRPYVTAALGPSMIYSTPYEREFFNSFGYGQAHYTVGGYIGFGAFFGFQEGNLVGLSFRYYFVPLKNQLESLTQTYKKEFGGFFITLNIGTVY